MRLALIADTHMPRGGRQLDPACVDALRAADAIVHVGDFFGAEVLDWFAELGPPLRAVHGNVDVPAVRERLPERAEFDAGGVRFGLIHDAGPARGRLERLRALFPEADAVVFGHSHMPLHESADGFQIFNPGSPTERRRAPRRSYGIARIERGRVEFEHVWLSDG